MIYAALSPSPTNIKGAGASVHACDLSQHVANMSDGASLLISARTRYCRWGLGGWRGGGGQRLQGSKHADGQKREDGGGAAADSDGSVDQQLQPGSGD